VRFEIVPVSGVTSVDESVCFPLPPDLLFADHKSVVLIIDCFRSYTRLNITNIAVV